MPLSLSPDLKSKIRAVTVGWITATVQVAEHDEGLWREIEAAVDRFRGMTMEQARKFPPVKALRDAYRALGNDPTRYRGSNEALVRRITQGKQLYRVNTVVDINNLISLETLHSAGTFNLSMSGRRSFFGSVKRAKAMQGSAGARSKSRAFRSLPISSGLLAARPATPNGP